VASFSQGFDRLAALNPHEIQVGILKRLRGTPIARHSEAFGMRYSPHTPYTVLATDRIDFATMQRLVRFARYWDLVANSGRFPLSMALLLGNSPFARFLVFSDWLYAETRQTHQIALDRLFDLLYTGLTETLAVAPAEAHAALASDYVQSGARGAPAFLKPTPSLKTQLVKSKVTNQATRQLRHVGA
jgi:hypothetical protein